MFDDCELGAVFLDGPDIDVNEMIKQWEILAEKSKKVERQEK